MRIIFILIPLFLLSNDLIIKYLNLKPFYYQNQIINLKLKIISPFSDLNITSTNNLKIKVSNENPFIYIIDSHFKNTDNPKFIFISSQEINKTIYLNNLINTKILNPIPNFSGVLADELNTSTPIALKTKEKILLSFTIKCKNCNIEDFHLKNEENLTIINNNTASFIITLPMNTKKLNFYYFNLNTQTFNKISIPIQLKENTISTQTNINPKENNFFTPINILLLIIIALFLILFIIFQKIWILIFPLIIGGYLVFQNLPKGEIYLKKGQKVTILPTKNSTIIYIVNHNQKTKILNKTKNYVQIKIDNKIGWVKNENN